MPKIPENDADFDRLIDDAAALTGLGIDPAYRPGVRNNLRATANAAKFVLAFELDDDAEPAPVFEP